MARRCTRLPAVHHATRRRAGLRATICAIAGALVMVPYVPLHAQPVNNDYYKGAGTELLRNVEGYHLDLARDKLRARQYESGYGDVMFMLRYYPNHPQALMLLIDYCEVWKGAQCDVPQALDNAIAINPRASTTFVVQGIYLFRAKKLPASIAAFEQALKLDPDSLNGHYNIGLAYLEAKQYDLANQHAQRAYQLGAPLPGLRDKLMRAGHWKPIDAAIAPQRADAPPVTTPR